MLEIPFLTLAESNAVVEAEIKLAVERVIKSGWYILGNECQNFERQMAASLTGAGGFVCGCNSGTDALILALKAAGVKAGDEVITVSHTAIPTITAIDNVGAIPIFVDIDPDTWVMDTKQAIAAITEKTKAIIPVHLYGNMADVNELKRSLSTKGYDHIAIIEDCAQAQGASLANAQAGTIGDVGAYSFYPSKNIGALGDGGAVFTNSEEIYEKLLMYRNYGQKDRYNALVSGGLNSRLDELQAAILSVKLPHLLDWNEYKRGLMQKYRQALADLPLRFQQATVGCTPAWHLCVIAIDDALNRDEIQSKLKIAGMQTLIHYPHPTHLQAAFKRYYRGQLPHTERLARQILSLPFSYTMSEELLEKISDIMHKVFNSL